eukprot:TRINITY_DN3214_c0_g1_i3.p2 TRINITY_DN3214_c0_g1~~TRINITY_DN3214_c0_g1_i3.p2  ORF type:complete len:132 (+),score=30.51 TRINITY_DN3214_c0_g1_i3:88-483(+)
MIFQQSVNYHPSIAITAINRKPNILPGRLCPRVDKLLLSLTTRVAMGKLLSTSPPGWRANAVGDGPIDSTADAAHWYALGVEVFQSVAHGQRFLAATEDFMRCRGNFRNTYGIDLIATSLSVPLCVFTSWS